MRNWPWPTKKNDCNKLHKKLPWAIYKLLKKEGVVWLVGLFSWRVCKIFFSYYIRQQTILADVTVGCQSNGRRVSSISDLLAPAAKAAPAGPPALASHGRLCCHAGLSAPYYSHRWQGIPLLTHTPCYYGATEASHHSRTSEPSYSSPRGHPLPRWKC